MKKPSDILNSFPEWQNDWQSHTLFCAYDQNSSEDFILKFWKKAITSLFQESIPGLTIEVEELKQLTHRNGRYPTGLFDIVSELASRGDLLNIEQLNEDIQDKEDSQYWGYWLKKTIKGMNKTKKEARKIACIEKLNAYTEKIYNLCQECERFTFTKAELGKYLKVSEFDIDVLVNFLILGGNALSFVENKGKNFVQLVKIKEKHEKEVRIKPEDSAMVSLNLTLLDIDKKVQELNESISVAHGQILKELKIQNRNSAKHFLLRKKMLSQKVEELLGARFNIEQQLLMIKQSLTNKEVFSTLKTTNQVLKQISPNLDEVNQVIEETKNNLDLTSEISETVSANYSEDISEDILHEFEALDLEELPSVPTTKLKQKPISLEEEFERLEPSEVVLN